MAAQTTGGRVQIQTEDRGPGANTRVGLDVGPIDAVAAAHLDGSDLQVLGLLQALPTVMAADPGADHRGDAEDDAQGAAQHTHERTHRRDAGGRAPVAAARALVSSQRLRHQAAPVSLR